MTEAPLTPELQAAFNQLIKDGTAKNTRLAYQRDLKTFWAGADTRLALNEHYPVAVETLIRFIIEHTSAIDKPLKVSTLRRYLASISVTHQGGLGLQVPILGEAAVALKAWLVKTGIRRGRLLLSIRPRGQLNDSIIGKCINQLIKKRIALAGHNPDQYGAHSLRSGFITEAGRQGVHLGEVMPLSGHKSLKIASGYYRKG